MLKLVGTLRNGSARLSPRSTNWCMPKQPLAGCSGAATAPQPNLEPEPPSAPKTAKSEVPQRKNVLVKKAFAELNISKSAPEPAPMNSVQLMEELLSSMNTKFINYKQAIHTMTLLSQQVDKGAIDLKTLESDERYKKLCRIITRKSGAANAAKSGEGEGSKSLEKTFSVDDLLESTEVKKLPLAQSIQLFCGLAVRQRRPRPLLRGLAENIMKSSTSLTIKNVADILYSMARLNFVEEDLLVKLSEGLREKIPGVRQSPIIGSILTSLGMMRYRDDALMETFCDWAIKHKEVLRTQDLCSLLMTLAVIGYSPGNFDVLYQDLVGNLKDTDMTKVSEWVDVVWSLVVLDRVSNKQVESTLNSKFIATLTDGVDIPAAKKHKLLNINAAAKYLLKDYSGPLLEESSPVMEAPIGRIKDKEVFVKAITDALANLFPSREHFRTNVDARTGFLIDVDFYIDKKLTALPVDKVSEDAKALRIAIIANYYHDFCVGKRNSLGLVGLHNRLLEAMGYRIIDISHTDFHTDDKLLKRISYLNDRIKTIVK
ncbi:FAST kinase domain-containing protein 4 [Diachasma alloeum]|uniref:FAST kinase domain-containing protein 4 n=1 Tax=Diachasma alloeum TaxID=454923 RepID=UPI0007381295|nr:FAST kinase domain-containing protein 4 [Diachasma alloeum]XP_015120726.1 FAST kinase domain-containing protein 4 [Diachasma alloeum]